MFIDWDTNTNLNAVWITVIFVVVLVINLLGTRAFGECEFYFASIKVITIVGLIILGLVIDLGGVGPSHDRLGFRYWVCVIPQFRREAGKITELAWCSTTPVL